MLVITRRPGEEIFFGEGKDKIVVKILSVKGRHVRVGIVADRETKITRSELAAPKIPR